MQPITPWAWMLRTLETIGLARRDVQKQVPDALGGAITTGALILITACLAALTMGYAIARAFAGATYAMPAGVAGGALWGFAVFFIDRALVAAIDKSKDGWSQFWSAVARVPFAVVIGIVLSKPILLRVASPVLDHELRDQRNEEIRNESASNATSVNLAAVNATADSANRARDAQLTVLNGEPNGYEVRAARAALVAAEATARRDMPRLIAERTSANDALAATRRPPITRADTIDLSRLIARANEAARRVSALEETRSITASQLDRAMRSWRQLQRNRFARLDSAALSAANTAELAIQRVAQMNSETEKSLSELLRENLINEYTTLRRIQANPKHPAAHALTTFEIGLDLLLILLELTPMAVKLLGRRTSLDDANIAAEFVDTEAVNCAANVKQAMAQKLANVQMNVYSAAMDIIEADLRRQLQTPGISRAAVDRILEQLGKLAA